MIREIIMSLMSSILESLISIVKVIGGIVGMEILAASGIVVVLLAIFVKKYGKRKS